MNYSIQTTPSFNQKISLGKIVQSQASARMQEPAPLQSNHISWEESEGKQWQHQASKKDSKAVHPRRKIFDKF